MLFDLQDLLPISAFESDKTVELKIVWANDWRSLQRKIKYKQYNSKWWVDWGYNSNIM